MRWLFTISTFVLWITGEYWTFSCWKTENTVIDLFRDQQNLLNNEWIRFCWSVWLDHIDFEVTSLCLFTLISLLNAELYSLLSQEFSYLTFVNEKEGFCNVKNQNPCKIFVWTYFMHAVIKYCHSMCVFVGYITQPVRRLWFFRADLICAARWTTSHSSGTQTLHFIRRWAKMIYCQTCFWSSWCVCSKCGDVPPESCWFSLLCSTASFVCEWFTDSMIQFWTIETLIWL